MKIKLSTVIALSIIVLLFAGVAYAVTNGPAAEARQRGKAQHEAISSINPRGNSESSFDNSEMPEKGKGHADHNKKEAGSKNGGECDCEDCAEHEHTVVDLKGKVIEVNLVEGNSFKIEAQDGKVYEVEVGPPWFWKEKGIEIVEGNILDVKAIEKEDAHGGNYAAVEIKNLSTGETAFLRKPEGEPLWKNCD